MQRIREPTSSFPLNGTSVIIRGNSDEPLDRERLEFMPGWKKTAGFDVMGATIEAVFAQSTFVWSMFSAVFAGGLDVWLSREEWGLGLGISAYASILLDIDHYWERDVALGFFGLLADRNQN
ncbi:hypothetical protein MRX96_011355 [Rhipicephalus microplus]